jgi:hemerythrin superfamily protein
LTANHPGDREHASGIFRRLADEHADVTELMQRVAGTIEVQVRQDAFPVIRRSLLTHARGEEQVFYPRLAEHAELRALVARSLEEHAEVERFLKRLDVKDKSTKQWGDLFAQMQRAVQEHVAREERELFPRAETLLGARQVREMVFSYDQVDDQDGFR